MALSNPRSQLRHRPINKVPLTPQQGMPLRARSAHSWQGDEQQEVIKTVSANTAWSQADERPGEITFTHRASTLSTSVVPNVTEVQGHSATATPCIHTRKVRTSPKTSSQSRSTHKLWQGPSQQLLFTGLGMMLLMVLYVLGFTVLVTCEDIHNDWTYGKVRTTQLDAVVGDHDSRQYPSHFIAINFHRHIEVIEFPGGDVTHARVFIGPQLNWANADKAYITIKVLDMNHDGKLDIDITVIGDPVMFSSTPTLHYDLIQTQKGFVYQQG